MSQGEGFSTGMQCAFVEPGNGTLANVAATVVDSSSIQCITPVWQPTAPSWQVHPEAVNVGQPIIPQKGQLPHWSESYLTPQPEHLFAQP